MRRHLMKSKIHRATITVDEQGVEAAAATAVEVVTFGIGGHRNDEPIEVRVDRPFLIAIQDVSTGLCLFLGRVVDPR